jgi:predicted cupin superfamily sugar epimerase
MERLTADDVKQLLGLRPHPREGGWFVRVYEASEMISPENFADDRYDGPRRTGTAIYYLLEPETFSEMHVLESDEIFHHYAGDPVEMLQLFPDGSSRHVVIGKDLRAGERPQVAVPRGIWQGSRLLGSAQTKADAHGWALLGCTVSPGFEFADYRSAPRAGLIVRWPGEAEMITVLTRE